jgi:hypothetical protein
MRVKHAGRNVLGLLASLFFVFFFLRAGNAAAAEYYVATTGSDSNAGTMDQPFASMQKGHDVAVAGDTVWIRGGTYQVVNGYNDSSGFTISKSGQSDTKRIKFWGYPGELPVFDFSLLRMSSTKKVNAIYVTGSWLHFKGLEIANVPQPGTFTNSGLLTEKASNNIFELLNIHHVGGPGLFINGGNGGNLILNCDAHDNYDAGSSQGRGENADGFGVHYQSIGPSTIVRGCRAWWNSDDGYDLISQEVPVTIENSWAMGNGYIDSGTGKGGNGNGFKAGSSKTGIRHIIRNCVAWKNTAAGFYANHSSGGNNWFNNTSYNNAVQYNMLASPPDDSATTIILSGALAHKMRNNVGFPDKNSNMGGVDTAFNTWDLKIVPSNNDFVGVTDTGFMGPRQADGSPPGLDFMKLRAGSQLIDKGTDVGGTVVGSAPDLGAYEYGLPSSGGMDGGSASGGGSGAGGDQGAGGMANGAAGTVGSGEKGGVLAGTGGSMSAAGGVQGSTGAQNGTMVIDPADSSGCACAVGAIPRGNSKASLLSVLAAMSLGLSRRRQPG